jgi:hypothetical protein
MSVLREASEKLSLIASRSARDSESDEVLIPPHLVQENADALHKRAKAEKEFAQVRKLLAKVTAELRERLASKVPLGPAGVPKLQLLPIDPVTKETLTGLLTDERIQSRVHELERLLETQLPRPAISPQQPQSRGA